MKPPIRLAIVDDSPAMRETIRTLVNRADDIVIAGEAADGEAAVALARSERPDVMTLDVSMPKLDGLKATEAIMSTSPTRIVVVCDTSQQAQMDLSFRAIAAGALELLPKPRGGAGQL